MSQRVVSTGVPTTGKPLKNMFWLDVVDGDVEARRVGQVEDIEACTSARTAP